MAVPSLMGKIALVTGSGSGIGRASALALARSGCDLVLTGRREAPLHETRDMIADEGGSPALVAPADLSDASSVARLFSLVQSEKGRLDILFNNAGTGAPAIPLEELSLEQWQSVVDTNLTAPFLCTQHAFRLMKSQSPQGGRVINNGSISADRPRPFSSPYTATKHAISGLTKSSALDGRAYNIACGQIDIGNAATPLTAKMATGVLQPSGELAAEPTMDVDDVGRAIVYMAGLPLESNVLFMTVMATKMPLIGRG